MGNVPFFLGSDTNHPLLLVHPKHVAQNVPFFSGLVQLTPPPTTWRTGPKNVAQGQSCTLDGLTRRVRSRQRRLLVKFHIIYGHLKRCWNYKALYFKSFETILDSQFLEKYHTFGVAFGPISKERDWVGVGRVEGVEEGGGDMQCKIFSPCPLWNITTHLHM